MPERADIGTHFAGGADSDQASRSNASFLGTARIGLRPNSNARFRRLPTRGIGERTTRPSLTLLQRWVFVPRQAPVDWCAPLAIVSSRVHPNQPKHGWQVKQQPEWRPNDRLRAPRTSISKASYTPPATYCPSVHMLWASESLRRRLSSRTVNPEPLATWWLHEPM